uniref:Uncharacterized protein n=1 Tax=Myoviridae sp. ct9Ns12 TaxID=2826626 RepID=A0A8S5MHB9_9CAUD|nr:MAG TPA: hypothetical protein [Myoviridae sp. ct9Ns12]
MTFIVSIFPYCFFYCLFHFFLFYPNFERSTS